jgi:hypothetical protein
MSRDGLNALARRTTARSGVHGNISFYRCLFLGHLSQCLPHRSGSGPEYGSIDFLRIIPDKTYQLEAQDAFRLRFELGVFKSGSGTFPQHLNYRSGRLGRGYDEPTHTAYGSRNLKGFPKRPRRLGVFDRSKEFPESREVSARIANNIPLGSGQTVLINTAYSALSPELPEMAPFRSRSSSHTSAALTPFPDPDLMILHNPKVADERFLIQQCNNSSTQSNESCDAL